MTCSDGEIMPTFLLRHAKHAVVLRATSTESDAIDGDGGFEVHLPMISRPLQPILRAEGQW